MLQKKTELCVTISMLQISVDYKGLAGSLLFKSFVSYWIHHIKNNFYFPNRPLQNSLLTPEGFEYILKSI